MLPNLCPGLKSLTCLSVDASKFQLSKVSFPKLQNLYLSLPNLEDTSAVVFDCPSLKELEIQSHSFVNEDIVSYNLRKLA
jgi:hypothetical protein